MEEIDKNIDNYQKIDLETLKKLSYLDAFAKETLRLYSPAVGIFYQNFFIY